MADVNVSGDPQTILGRVVNIEKYLSGELPDDTGAIRDALTAVGLVTLANIHNHFNKLSQGGTGDDGTVWERLSVVTLALRRKDAGISAISRMLDELTGKNGKASPSRRRMFLNNAKRMRAFYERGADRAARRRALKILELMKPYISDTRYNKTKKELEDIGKPKKSRKAVNRLIFASAGALILRDTGDLFNSLEPFLGAVGQIFNLGPGWVEIGTKKSYAKYHQSPEPRKMKADGTPILPRRPFIPDKIPQSWYDDAVNTLRSILGSANWMLKFLSGVK